MDVGELKQRLQDHFTDGLVTIVGSGLSVAEGVPSMGALAKHLQEHVPARLTEESKDIWDNISAELDAFTDLENTLLKYQPDSALEAVIVELTAKLILDAETTIVEEIIAGERTLRFSRLLTHMLAPNTGIPVITTNYDRLIEFGAEVVGLAVDTLFVGQHLGQLNPKESQYSLCRDVRLVKGKYYRMYAKHLVVLKPHGSLDWYQYNNDPVRCSMPISSLRLMITPGLNKFRGGYDRPFDAHRERANKEIDRAARYLILGYGFNDDHLQTHLEHQLKKGKPTVLITRTLSPKAEALLPECDGMLAISADPSQDGTVITTNSESTFLPGPSLWDLGDFISEVLEP